jgi:hypothetical protein
MLRYNSSTHSFFRIFIMKGCWFFSQRLLIHRLGWLWLFFLKQAIYVLYNIYWFTYVEPSLQHYNETNLIMVFDLIHVLLNLICKYFVRDFCIFVH